MLRVELRLEDPTEWGKIFDPESSTLFIAHSNPPSVETEVRIDLYASPVGPHVILRGKVISRRMSGDDSLPRGFSIAFGPYERDKVSYVTTYVRGGFIDRRKNRLPIRLKVDYGDTGGVTTSHTRDINGEGLFIITTTPLAEGSQISLVIHVPGFPQPVAATALVSHTVLVEDEDIPGMGLKFIFEPGQEDTFTAVIDNLTERFESGDLPDECLM